MLQGRRSIYDTHTEEGGENPQNLMFCPGRGGAIIVTDLWRRCSKEIGSPVGVALPLHRYRLDRSVSGRDEDEDNDDEEESRGRGCTPHKVKTPVLLAKHRR